MRRQSTNFSVHPAYGSLRSIPGRSYKPSRAPVMLLRYWDWWLFQSCTKDIIPESGGNTKAILIVKKMMLQVLFLKLFVPKREILMMH